MRFCTNCGNGIVEGQKFCPFCGASMAFNSGNASAPAVVNSEENLLREEQEFLDITHRILRWEHKAWKIEGKVFTILGAVFAGLFLLIAFIGMLSVNSFGYDAGGEAIMFVGLLYAVIYGGIFLVVGIVQLKAAKRIPFYLKRMYYEFDLVNNRCGSIGMIIFCGFFSGVAVVFYIINFARIKANKNVIERILTRQKLKSPIV